MAGIDPRLMGHRRTGPDRKLDPMREVELVNDYVGGMKLKDMQAKYDLSKKGVYNVLDRHDCKRNVKPAHKPEGHQEQAA